ncbi:MAG TPA: response regulator [bacterium]|nr:response regulator [bacterium]HPN29612.1 response regulator [bacterium]
MENINCIYSEIVDLLTYESFQKGEKFKKVHLLVIDDSYSNRKHFIKKLEGKKIFEIIEAKNGIEGLYMLGKYGDLIRIVFFDIWMPIMDGPEFFIKAHKADLITDIPLVATVPAINKKLLIELIRRGVYSYLPHPFSEEQLMTLIRDAFTKKVRGIKDLIDEISNINTHGRNTMEYSNFIQFKLLDEKIEYETETDISEQSDNQDTKRRITGNEKNEDNRELCRIRKSYSETFGNDKSGVEKKFGERTLNELKRDRTGENNPKLFYLNECLKKNIVLYLVLYISERNYSFDYYEDFVDFIEKSGELENKCNEVISEFDEKGMEAVYNSDKELFIELYKTLSDCRLQNNELDSTELLKSGIFYYLIAYWNFLLKEKIKTSYHAEYIDLKNVLNQGSIDSNKRIKYFEQLTSKWKSRVSSVVLTLQNLKSSGDSLIKEASKYKV